MFLLIFGAVLSLGGVGLIMNKFSLVGVIVVLIGGSIILKGRNNLDKK